MKGTTTGSLHGHRVADHQQLLLDRYGDVIGRRSFERIDKRDDRWILVGDDRERVAAEIGRIVEDVGLGIGLLVLHLQQLATGHLRTDIRLGGRVHDLARPTERLGGLLGEHVLHVPLRGIRSDFTKLAQLDLVKPKSLWQADRVTSHESDGHPCLFCSCAEINPSEVVLAIDGKRFGLSRDYAFGCTFAPFGNPLTTVHVLAWDCAASPLTMSRTPVTVPDLVQLTRVINRTIRDFFKAARMRDYPQLDGMSNGWAGNSIPHQHFQFFQPEYPLPLARRPSADAGRLLQRDTISVRRMAWPVPAYRIHAAKAVDAGLVGSDLTCIWRTMGGERRVAYKSFPEGHVPTEADTVPAHTQNIYIPARGMGRTVYVLLRDRDRVHYVPARTEHPDDAGASRKLAKRDVGILEATGTLLVDDAAGFERLRAWSESEISRQFLNMLMAVAPATAMTEPFDRAVSELFS